MYLEAVLEITLRGSNILRTKCTKKQEYTELTRIIKLAKHKKAS